MARRDPDAAELLRIAEAAAVATGDLLLAHAANPGQVRMKASALDLVTEADVAAEAQMRKLILTQRPHDSVLGEEHGETLGSTPIRWIVDGLDGTTNYVAGIAEWAVSVAVEHRTEGVVAGVVHAPRLGRTFTGLRDGGARSNGSLLRLPDVIGPPLDACVVATGFSADPVRRYLQVRLLGGVLPHVRDVRCRGAASLELCAVAAGELGAYFETDLESWDVAAGALVAGEAGATVRGGPMGDGSPLVAAPARTARDLADLLAAAAGR
jgi:myo-inositol-1(or 4)-monophosphatase